MNDGNMIYGFMFLAGLATAFLTAFYTFRMIYTVFYGKPRYDEEHIHAHESGSLMRNPLIILASIVFGTGILATEGLLANILDVIGISGFSIFGILGLSNLNIFNEHIFEKLLEPWYLHFDTTSPVLAASDKALFYIFIPGIALGLVFLGIVLAYWMYHPSGSWPNLRNTVNQSALGRPVATLLKQKYYMDALYVGFAHFIRDGFAEFVRYIDSGIDFIVDGTGRTTKEACGYAVAFDDKVIDGTVRKLSSGTFAVGKWLQRRQTGIIENYNQQLAIGLIALIIIILGYFYVIPFVL